MPIETSETFTQSGHAVLRAVFKGEVTVEEARRYHSSITPGGRYEWHGHLVLGNVTGVGADVKKVLGSVRPDPANPVPVALLIDSALMRMTANMVMRLSGNDNNEAFKDEGRALEWLDERLTVFHARRPAPLKKAT
ncbi:MAG: hypothetical protein JNJ54_18125 [Myxococcaceae bacterium]|nr:hypothetical protein [Myxococcaceae bacterium]